MRRWALAACLLFWLPLAAGAGVPATAPPTPERPDKSTWVRRLQESQAALARARARYERALAEYTRMRTHGKEAGDAKLAIIEEREAAKAALEEADRHLQQLIEDARRAGVPPGWVREALPEGVDGSPASPAD